MPSQVQLIESPIFIHLRLQLLEPKNYPFLVKSLYGLLMLLPQSPAFKSLKIRLESVSTLGLLNCIPDSEYAHPATGPRAKSARSKMEKAKVPRKDKDEAKMDFRQLLSQFQQMQTRHRSNMTETFRLNSLLSAAHVSPQKAAKD